eukprot:CAMPEP_0116011298 /NCGR_PEP_ID=MMETSP0321-20121206/4492_1 /TAXON_ID=163516 /ORGANISM="Leptocylindrus danicus var. danicus, Strain B650" /LENGTH=1075 /DNA_ID=CAMNT_0003480519 /DNA_START=597 /DNA_END=3824 /DNA_ORIENTATION=-
MKLACELFHEKTRADAYALKNNDLKKSIIDITNQHFICTYGSTSIRRQRLNDFFTSIMAYLGSSGVFRAMARMLRLEGTTPLSRDLQDIFFGMKGWLHDRGFVHTSSSPSAWPCIGFSVSRNHMELSFRETVSFLGWSFPPIIIRAIGSYIWSFATSFADGQELREGRSDQDHSWWFAQDGKLVDMHEVLEGVITLIDEFDQTYQHLTHDLFDDGAIPKDVLTPCSSKQITNDGTLNMENKSGAKIWQEERISALKKLQHFLQSLIVQDEGRQGRISEEGLCGTWIKWKKEFSLNIDEDNENVDNVGLLLSDCSGMVEYIEIIAMIHAEILECAYVPNLASIRRNGTFRSFERETCEKLVEFVKHYRFKRCRTEMNSTDLQPFQRSTVSSFDPFSISAPPRRNVRTCPPMYRQVTRIEHNRNYFERPYTSADMLRKSPLRSDDSIPKDKPVKWVDMSFSDCANLGTKLEGKPKTKEYLNFTEGQISAQHDVIGTANSLDFEHVDSKLRIFPNIYIRFPGVSPMQSDVCSRVQNPVGGHIGFSPRKQANTSIMDQSSCEDIAAAAQASKTIVPELSHVGDHLTDRDTIGDFMNRYSLARKMCAKRRQSSLRCDSHSSADGATTKKGERVVKRKPPLPKLSSTSFRSGFKHVRSRRRTKDKVKEPQVKAAKSIVTKEVYDCASDCVFEAHGFASKDRDMKTLQFQEGQSSEENNFDAINASDSSSSGKNHRCESKFQEDVDDEHKDSDFDHSISDIVDAYQKPAPISGLFEGSSNSDDSTDYLGHIHDTEPPLEKLHDQHALTPNTTAEEKINHGFKIKNIAADLSPSASHPGSAADVSLRSIVAASNGQSHQRGNKPQYVEGTNHHPQGKNRQENIPRTIIIPEMASSEKLMLSPENCRVESGESATAGIICRRSSLDQADGEKMHTEITRASMQEMTRCFEKLLMEFFHYIPKASTISQERVTQQMILLHQTYFLSDASPMNCRLLDDGSNKPSTLVDAEIESHLTLLDIRLHGRCSEYGRIGEDICLQLEDVFDWNCYFKKEEKALLNIFSKKFYLHNELMKHRKGTRLFDPER